LSIRQRWAAFAEDRSGTSPPATPIAIRVAASYTAQALVVCADYLSRHGVVPGTDDTTWWHDPARLAATRPAGRRALSSGGT
jgi:hypothetical protein